MKTLMVFGVPRELRSETKLCKYFEGLGLGDVDTVVLCRNWSLLQTGSSIRVNSYCSLSETWPLLE